MILFGVAQMLYGHFHILHLHQLVMLSLWQRKELRLQYFLYLLSFHGIRRLKKYLYHHTPINGKVKPMSAKRP